MRHVIQIRYFLLFFIFIGMACERKGSDTSTKIKFEFPAVSAGRSPQSISSKNVSELAFTGPVPSTINDISCFYVLVSGPEDNLRQNSCQVNHVKGVRTEKFGIVHGGVVRGSSIEVSVPSGNDRIVWLIGFSTSVAGYCPPVQNVDEAKMSNPFVVGRSAALRLEPGATQEVPIALTLDQDFYLKDCAGPDFGNHIGGGEGTQLGEPDQINIYKMLPSAHTSQNYCIPFSIELKKQGSNILTSSAKSFGIRKISDGPLSVQTKFGLLGTSGSIDGNGPAAKFFSPSQMVYDADGNAYVADTGNNKIRKIDSSGNVTTLAGTGVSGSTNGSSLLTAEFSQPTAVAYDKWNNILYVADKGNHTIRKLDLTANVVTVYAGLAGSSGAVDGTQTAARFYLPTSLVIEPSINGTLYVVDTGNHIVREIQAGGIVTTLAGSPSSSGFIDGTGSAARFKSPTGLAIDSASFLYIADKGNHAIRKINLSSGAVTTIAGTGAPGSTNGTPNVATFSYPEGVAVDASGKIYVVDTLNFRIRKIDLAADNVSNYAGSGTSGTLDGLVLSANLGNPTAIAIQPSGDLMLVDAGAHSLRRIGSVTSTADMHFYNNYNDCKSSASEVSEFKFEVGDGRKAAFFKSLSAPTTPEQFSLFSSAAVGPVASSPITYTVVQAPSPYADEVASSTQNVVYGNFYCQEVLLYGYLGSPYNTAAKMSGPGTTLTPIVSGLPANLIYFTPDCSDKMEVNSYTIPAGDYFTKVGIWTRDLSFSYNGYVTFNPTGWIATGAKVIAISH